MPFLGKGIRVPRKRRGGPLLGIGVPLTRRKGTPPTVEGLSPAPRQRGTAPSVNGYPHLGKGVYSRHSLDGYPSIRKGVYIPVLRKGGTCPSDEAVPVTRERASGPRGKCTRSSASGHPSVEKRRSSHGRRSPCLGTGGTPRPSKIGYPSIGKGEPVRVKGRSVPRERVARTSDTGAAARRKKGTRPLQTGYIPSLGKGRTTVRKGHPSSGKGIPIFRKRGTRPSVHGLPFLGNVVRVAGKRGCRPSRKDVPVPRTKGNQSQGKCNALLGKGYPTHRKRGTRPSVNWLPLPRKRGTLPSKHVIPTPGKGVPVERARGTTRPLRRGYPALGQCFSGPRQPAPVLPQKATWRWEKEYPSLGKEVPDHQKAG